MSEESYITYDGVAVTEDSLAHYGILRKSGRYPWGSGKTPNQRNRDFLSYVDDMKKKGLSEKEIADGIGISITKLRAVKAIAKNEQKAANEAMAMRLKEKGMSNVAIGNRMGINESSVRALLDPSNQAKTDVLVKTAEQVRKRVDEVGYLDIGKGVSRQLGISETRLNTAISMLEEDGYSVFNNIRVPQVNSKNQYTPMKVLTKPDTTFSDVMQNRDKIRSMAAYSEDKGHTFETIKAPKHLSSKRLKVNYAEDGGIEADGLMYIRPGAEGLSLGKSRYAQVRISVDGTHYLKGMAIYKNDLPDGVDIVFNTNKSNTGNKLDALKKLKGKEGDNANDRFGASVSRQKGHLNILSEEGAWEGWNRTLASQMLSKQKPELAKQQLDKFYDAKKAQFDEIMSLTNPVIRKHLLESYSDDIDSAAVKLRGAAIPKMASHVILPVKSLKDNEVYAPNYHNGDKVVLIRYPHGGIFEIPELTVNNRHPEAKSLIGPKARDAIGINARVAEKLSGADFDGDTVMVIPNNNRQIQTKKTLKGLENFDPKASYPAYPGMKVISDKYKQKQMGIVSNLITDMTIKGANDNELAAAVRHSMVIIDAEKHKLNYKQSEKDNGIRALQKKYQPKPDGRAGGASTIISRASSEQSVDHRVARKASDGGPIDPKTGKKVYTYTNEGYTNAKGEFVKRRTKSTKMAETDDAFSLVSTGGGTEMEKIYANHANKLKALANQARKDTYHTPPLKYNPQAKIKYKSEVASLDSKLNTALKNKPLRRQAQVIANATVKQKTLANPDLDDEHLKRIKRQALAEAMVRSGAEKSQIHISDKEWEAIQAGAITNNKLTEIVKMADQERVKQLATPHTGATMTSSRIAKAKAMANNGNTRAEIASALGVSVGTISTALEGE